MKIIYVADDGVHFDDKFECEHHDWILSHPHLKDVRCYDRDGNELEDVMARNTYHHSRKIVVPTDEAAKELNDLVDYAGYSYYSQITGAGTWVYKIVDGIIEALVKEAD